MEASVAAEEEEVVAAAVEADHAAESIRVGRIRISQAAAGIFEGECVRSAGWAYRF